MTVSTSLCLSLRSIVRRLALPGALIALTSLAHAAQLFIGPTQGPPTSGVVCDGTGFGPNELINLRFDTNVVAGGQANASGAFQVAFLVPADALPGGHLVRATGVTSGVTLTREFFVRTNWLQARFDTAHTGANRYENVLNAQNLFTLVPKWVASAGTSVGSGVVASVAVADGSVYVHSQNGRLYRFDALTGVQQGNAFTAGAGTSAPAIGRGRAYVGALLGLYAFPQGCVGTCSPQWISDFGSTISPPATFWRGKVYASTDAGRVDVIDGTTGTILSTVQININGPMRGYSSVTSGRLLIPSESGLYSYATSCLSLCNPQWFAPTDSPLEDTVAIANGVAYSASTAGTLYAIDRDSGAILWSTPTSANPSAPAVAAGRVFVSTADGVLWAFPTDCPGGGCAPLWVQNLGLRLSDPVVANGIVYVGVSNDQRTQGYIAAFKTSDGTLAASILTDGGTVTPPSIADGRLYVGTATGVVAMFALP